MYPPSGCWTTWIFTFPLNLIWLATKYVSPLWVTFSTSTEADGESKAPHPPPFKVVRLTNLTLIPESLSSPQKLNFCKSIVWLLPLITNFGFLLEYILICLVNVILLTKFTWPIAALLKASCNWSEVEISTAILPSDKRVDFTFLSPSGNSEEVSCVLDFVASLLSRAVSGMLILSSSEFSLVFSVFCVSCFASVLFSTPETAIPFSKSAFASALEIEFSWVDCSFANTFPTGNKLPLIKRATAAEVSLFFAFIRFFNCFFFIVLLNSSL